MYFINKEHKENFHQLLFKYNRRNDSQYMANVYVASVPDVFDELHLESMDDTIGGPLHSLMAWDEEEERYVPSAAGLTGSTRALIKIGLSLYNGYLADLDYSFSEEYANVVIQACKIRYKIQDETYSIIK